MKRNFVCFVILAAFIVLSCQSAPETPAPTPEPTPATPAPARPSEPAAQPAPRPQEQTPQRVEEGPPRQIVQDPVINPQTRLDMTDAQEYTVVMGDFLSEITRRFYGGLTDVGAAGKKNGFYYPVIILASPDCNITDPDLIFPGMNLKIPDLKRNLAIPSAREAIKESLREAARIYNGKGKPDEDEGLRKLADSL